MGPKKVVAHKRPRASSSPTFDQTLFVSTEAEAHFNESCVKRAGLKERRLETSGIYIQHFTDIIESRGWQFFCQQPKAAAMIMVREFYANAHKVQGSRAMVQRTTIHYGASAINQLLRIQNPPPTIDQVITYMKNADLAEVAQAIYGHEMEWTVIQG